MHWSGIRFSASRTDGYRLVSEEGSANEGLAEEGVENSVTMFALLEGAGESEIHRMEQERKGSQGRKEWKECQIRRHTKRGINLLQNAGKVQVAQNTAETSENSHSHAHTHL